MEANTQQLEDKARELQMRYGPKIDEAKRNLTDMNQRVVSWVTANPGLSLIGAVTVGFLVGKIAARR